MPCTELRVLHKLIPPNLQNTPTRQLKSSSYAIGQEEVLEILGNLSSLMEQDISFRACSFRLRSSTTFWSQDFFISLKILEIK